MEERAPDGYIWYDGDDYNYVYDLSSDASKLLMRTVFSQSFFSVQNGSGLCMQGRIQAEEKNGTFSHKQEANTFTI